MDKIICNRCGGRLRVLEHRKVFNDYVIEESGDIIEKVFTEDDDNDPSTTSVYCYECDLGKDESESPLNKIFIYDCGTVVRREESK